MNKRTRDEYTARSELQSQGWPISKTDRIQFHGPGETNAHFLAKCQTGYFLSSQGHRIDSEVQNEYTGATADIIAYGKEKPFVVELETNITPKTTEKKLEQFYEGEPFVECHILEVTDFPDDRHAQLEWLSEQLGGSL